jgi:hypothetical protein
LLRNRSAHQLLASNRCGYLEPVNTRREPS